MTRAFRPGARRAQAAGTLSLAERVAVNFSAQLGAQLILAVGGLISLAVTTRYLDLRHYGALITALIFVSLFTIATDFGITTIGGRELAKDARDRQRVLSINAVSISAPRAFTPIVPPPPCGNDQSGWSTALSPSTPTG